MCTVSAKILLLRLRLLLLLLLLPCCHRSILDSLSTLFLALGTVALASFALAEWISCGIGAAIKRGFHRACGQKIVTYLTVHVPFDHTTCRIKRTQAPCYFLFLQYTDTVCTQVPLTNRIENTVYLKKS